MLIDKETAYAYMTGVYQEEGQSQKYKSFPYIGLDYPVPLDKDRPAKHPENADWEDIAEFYPIGAYHQQLGIVNEHEWEGKCCKV